MRNRWDVFVQANVTDTIPHCDSRILHAPGECDYCDGHPDWQRARRTMNIAFTGHAPTPGQEPCPADADRPADSPADHRRWAGNKPTKSFGDPTWPAESFPSLVVYGDRGGRAAWPLRERIARRIARPFRNLQKRLHGWKREGPFWIHR